MFLFILTIMALPLLAGLWPTMLKGREEEMVLMEVYITGVLSLFAAALSAACVIIKLDGSFTDYRRLLYGLTLALCLSALLFGHRQLAKLWHKGKEQGLATASLIKKGLGRQTSGGRERRQVFLLLCVCLLFLLQIGNLFLYVPAVGADATTETVYVTQLTDTVFQYHPLTGQPLERGIYPLHKLASLPLLYSAWSRLCGLDVRFFLYTLIPLWVFGMNYGIMTGLTRLFFREQRERRYGFLIVYGLLNLMGDYHPATYAYVLLHEGWKGGALTAAVLVPFALYLLYRLASGNGKLFSAAGLLLCGAGVLFVQPFFAPALIVDSTREGNQWGLFFVSLLALVIMRDRMRKKWRKEELLFFCLALATCLLAANPLPVLGICYVASEIGRAGEDRQRGTAALIGILLMASLTGTILPYRADITKKKYVQESERAIQEAIHELVVNYGDSACLAAPNAVMEEARLENASLKLPYGKDLWQENCGREIADIYTEEERYLYMLMQTDYLQPDEAAAAAALEECNILVLREAMSESVQEQYGWYQFAGTPGYALYCRQDF